MFPICIDSTSIPPVAQIKGLKDIIQFCEPYLQNTLTTYTSIAISDLSHYDLSLFYQNCPLIVDT